jgi:hypothetical protein
MRRLVLLIILGILLTGNGRPSRAQILTAEQWRENLAFLSASIRAQHPNPFHTVSEEFFRDRIGTLFNPVVASNLGIAAVHTETT